MAAATDDLGGDEVIPEPRPPARLYFPEPLVEMESLSFQLFPYLLYFPIFYQIGL